MDDKPSSLGKRKREDDAVEDRASKKATLAEPRSADPTDQWTKQLAELKIDPEVMDLLVYCQDKKKTLTDLAYHSLKSLYDRLPFPLETKAELYQNIKESPVFISEHLSRKECWATGCDSIVDWIAKDVEQRTKARVDGKIKTQQTLERLRVSAQTLVGRIFALGETMQELTNMGVRSINLSRRWRVTWSSGLPFSDIQCDVFRRVWLQANNLSLRRRNYSIVDNAVKEWALQNDSTTIFPALVSEWSKTASSKPIQEPALLTSAGVNPGEQTVVYKWRKNPFLNVGRSRFLYALEVVKTASGYVPNVLARIVLDYSCCE